MVTALDSPADRVRGLEAGADDFLTKPVSDVVLIARVALADAAEDDDRRAAHARDHLARDRRAGAGARARWPIPGRAAASCWSTTGRRPTSGWRRCCSTEHTVDVETNPSEALFHAAEGNYDLLIVSLGLDNFDGLRLCSQARSLERTPARCRSSPSSDADNNARLLRGLEIGVNDYLLRPVDKNELLARARTQIRKRRYTDHLRDNVQNSIEAAITDALTGLHNRRYMESHLGDAGRAGRRAAASRWR